MTTELLPASALRAAFLQPRRRIFRLETLQAYTADDETALLEAFRGGRPRPADPGKDEWTAVVRAGRASGTSFQRAHVCQEPLSEYLRYELTWSYQPSAEAGEDIGIVGLEPGQPWPADLPRSDFWLFDETVLFLMSYDAAGRWLGVERRSDSRSLTEAAKWREAALRRSTAWWQYVAARPSWRGT